MYSYASDKWQPPQSPQYGYNWDTQSTKFCSENGTNFPVSRKYCPSIAPTIENAQHEPQWPCDETTGFTAPSVRQSIEVGRSKLILGWRWWQWRWWWWWWWWRWRWWQWWWWWWCSEPTISSVVWFPSWLFLLRNYHLFMDSVWIKINSNLRHWFRQPWPIHLGIHLFGC